MDKNTGRCVEQENDMNEFHNTELQQKIDEAISELVREQNLHIENLTREQVTEVVAQLFKSGDIIRLIQCNTNAQSVTYLPYRREQELLGEIERLKAMLFPYNA